MTTLITCDDGTGHREIHLAELPSFLPKAVMRNTTISDVKKDEGVEDVKPDPEEPVPEEPVPEEPTPPAALLERTLRSSPDEIITGELYDWGNWTNWNWWSSDDKALKEETLVTVSARVLVNNLLDNT